MGRAALWTAIHDTLSSEIADGHYAPGDRIPTEAQLANRFGVNRHTIRRALAGLADGGIVYAKRGAGVFVRHVPTLYPIGKRVRFRQNLLAARRVPERRILHLETRAASAREREGLQLVKGMKVHVYEGVSLSSATPLAVFRSIFPAARFPDLLEALRQTRSVTAAFNEHGVTDYTRASTQITAKAASSTHAALLEVPQGSPILRTTGLNVDAAGQGVEWGRSWFAADRVTLTLEAGEAG